MDKLLIFAGTTEGRLLAEFLGRNQTACLVCTATEYGGQLIKENAYVRAISGRLEEEAMEALIKKEEITLVVDATHPYAAEVSKNIRRACTETKSEYLRLVRGSLEEEGCIQVDSLEDAVAYLKDRPGNILAATGSKELAKYTAISDYKTRVFARVLSTPEVAAACAALGFQGKNLICMQGPFSEELNTAMMRQFQISYLVTKESGRQGGYEEKVRAAKNAGAQVVLIGRPEKEAGMTEEELRAYLCKRLSIHVRQEISLIGIGMGNPENMTREAWKACEKAQVFIGAGRMLEAVAEWKKPTFASYKEEEILKYIKQNPQYERIAILLSGDVGFYSGGKRLLEAIPKDQLKVYSGISSVVYFCGKLGTCWEDVKLVSVHGRGQNLIGAVKHHKKVFALVGRGEGIEEICQKLMAYGMEDVEISVGENLSYENERIVRGRPGELLTQKFAPLSVILLENPRPEREVTHGLPDEAFLRDKVPMTKSEVRSISLSKLALTREAVVYDVGAGTGSVAIEMARMAWEGRVYAIEKKELASALILENKKKFAADHLTLVEGLAPEALEDLEPPTHAFIGGSSGNLKEIMALLLKKNPQVKMVINAIALETVAEALEAVKTLPVTEVDVVTAAIGKAKEVGHYHMMMGQNPVYIISCKGGEGA